MTYMKQSKELAKKSNFDILIAVALLDLKVPSLKPDWIQLCVTVE